MHTQEQLTFFQMFFKRSTFFPLRDNLGPKVVWAVWRVGCVSKDRSDDRSVSIFGEVKKSKLTLDRHGGHPSATGVSPLPIRKPTTS